ncbi:MAG: nitrilase-related carbon-nitrogen hydrolase [Planctomycetota bacterium]|jgi:N-carbamoylputrescine amidase
MKIALIQQHAGRDQAENMARGLMALEQAARGGARLAAFAELAFTPFLPQRPAGGDVLEWAETVPGPTTDRFAEKARELGVVVVLNLFEKDGDETYDTSPVIDADGTLMGKNRMVHVIEAPCFHEKGYYTPGDLGAGVFETAAGRIGVAICYDRHFPEYMRALGLKGAELVIVPQAGSIGEWPPGVFEAELQTASFQNGYFSALVNRVGREEHLTFAGESFIVDPRGQVLSQAPQGEDHILIQEIDYSLIPDCAARKHFLADRRPDLYDDFLKGGA